MVIVFLSLPAAWKPRPPPTSTTRTLASVEASNITFLSSPAPLHHHLEFLYPANLSKMAGSYDRALSGEFVLSETLSRWKADTDLPYSFQVSIILLHRFPSTDYLVND